MTQSKNRRGWGVREIKFRAWFHGAGDPRVEPYMKYSDPFPVIFWQAVDEFPIAVEVMQFTGLHDKNGKEIYEGDIVEYFKFERGVVKHGEFEFTFDAGWHNSSEDVYGWFYEEQNGEQHRLSKFVSVIGNIYEHPQLLE